jgi:hypothetical protein
MRTGRVLYWPSTSMLLATARTMVRDEFQTFIAGEILQAAEPSRVEASSNGFVVCWTLLGLSMSPCAQQRL